jgi:hypothetical protein
MRKMATAKTGVHRRLPQLQSTILASQPLLSSAVLCQGDHGARLIGVPSCGVSLGGNIVVGIFVAQGVPTLFVLARYVEVGDPLDRD